MSTAADIMTPEHEATLLKVEGLLRQYHTNLRANPGKRTAIAGETMTQLLGLFGNPASKEQLPDVGQDIVTPYGEVVGALSGYFDAQTTGFAQIDEHNKKGPSVPLDPKAAANIYLNMIEHVLGVQRENPSLASVIDKNDPSLRRPFSDTVIKRPAAEKRDPLSKDGSSQGL